jgi:hypothetical protein
MNNHYNTFSIKISHDFRPGPSFQGLTEKSQFQNLITSLLFLLEQKNSIDGVYKLIPKKLKNLYIIDI